ncbi:MAG: thiamine pyrophosphate-binding protein [Candidatus Omnitrophota bacterium]
MINKAIAREKINNTVTKKANRTNVFSDYSKVIVKKPWGYEYLVFKNEFVAIWMLHIVRKRRTSMHCHPAKRTGLVLLSGKAKFHTVDKEIELDMLEGVVIEKGVFHSTEAFNPLLMNPQSENGIWVMEIESPPLKTDLVRMKDKYGRAGTSYEGTEHMVHKTSQRLRFGMPNSDEILCRRFLDCVFTVRKGAFDKEIPGGDAFISVIGQSGNVISNNPCLTVGNLVSFKKFQKAIQGENLDEYLFLTIEKEKRTVKVSDYIFLGIAKLGVKKVFAVCGGGAMHLVDSAGNNKDLEYIATQHEQAAAMAAEGYARTSGKPGICLVTSGPGGTNTITGLCGAWIDSIPTIFISGQVTKNTLLQDTGLRQFGIQESDITTLVSPITKYAVTVTDETMIKYHLQKAIHYATTGRPGPVWLDIPLDIQSKLVNIEELRSFCPDKNVKLEQKEQLRAKIIDVIALLKKSKRPVIISGYGIRLAGAEKKFLELAKKLKIPVISSWTSSDLIPTANKCYIGRSGIMGDRAGNFTIQNADLVLVIGSRMSIPQVGYNYAVFAREAKKIVVDIDKSELKKKSLKPDISINADAKEFITEFLCRLKRDNVIIRVGDWLEKCQHWKRKYPVVLPEYRKNKNKINSFHFIDVLSERLDKDAVVVTDMGTSFTCTMQTFKIKAGQRLFTSSGHASMGFGLPGAIGACFGNGRKKTICISGDGGLQMNIQEFQTLVHYKLPIILFILNNKGYLTIKLMQQNHFGRYVGSEADSGLSTPNFVKVAKAYGIKAVKISTQKELDKKIDTVLREPGPFVCEISMPEDQQLIPRISSVKKTDGTIVSRPLEDLYPFLKRDEFLENMIINPIEPLK